MEAIPFIGEEFGSLLREFAARRARKLMSPAEALALWPETREGDVKSCVFVRLRWLDRTGEPRDELRLLGDATESPQSCQFEIYDCQGSTMELETGDAKVVRKQETADGACSCLMDLECQHTLCDLSSSYTDFQWQGYEPPVEFSVGVQTRSRAEEESSTAVIVTLFEMTEDEYNEYIDQLVQ